MTNEELFGMLLCLELHSTEGRKHYDPFSNVPQMVIRCGFLTEIVAPSGGLMHHQIPLFKKNIFYLSIGPKRDVSLMPNIPIHLGFIIYCLFQTKVYTGELSSAVISCRSMHIPTH